MAIKIRAREIEKVTITETEKEEKRQGRDDNRIGVWLPFIFGMDLVRNRVPDGTRSANGTANEVKGTGMDLSVLGGLVRVNLDRTRDANGVRGPVNVSVFGQKVAGRKRR